MKFNDKLVQLRKQHGFSQETLADMLGVSRQAVSKWETALTQPEMLNILRLCEIFAVTPNELLGCEEDSLTQKHETSAEETSDTLTNELQDKETTKNAAKEEQKKYAGWMSMLTTVLIVGMAITGIIACLKYSSETAWKEKEQHWLSERFSVEGYDISFVENATKYSKRLRIIFTPSVYRADFQYKIVVTDETGFNSQYDAQSTNDIGVFTGTFLISEGKEYVVTISMVAGEYTYSDAIYKIYQVTETGYLWEKIEN